MSESDLNLTSSIKCPFCNSESIKIVIEKKSNDYDVTAGILGLICLGPIGFLCGLCGAGDEKVTTTGICNDCGKRFNG